ncbi:hypothetical protein [Fimbriimonas ginsengisoli]|uniref:Putative aminopeptidase n=1 Tax=Fimbriimonas ginsengisoli Gsoil 348 TaxID=661478 RepID=A0A068NQG0_FIMGI|nr:hypothetical protein [Fimbriimonas ginsengisoli]AIE85803.1 putative aminopeptidase [Fimbriimonas ginsengisoli Gsoil 348]
MVFLPLLLLRQADSPDAFLQKLAAAVRDKDREAIAQAFDNKAGSSYLFEMAKSRGGLQKLKVGMLPAPPGWTGYGRYWVVFHTFQDLEDYHDPVYRVIETPGGLRLGSEVSEADSGGWRIRKVSHRTVLSPEESRADISVQLDLTVGSAQRAPVFRLNEVYQFSPGRAVTADDRHIARPHDGRLLRVGSLLIPWTSHPADSYRFNYGATLPVGDREDSVSAKAAYLTSWWIPSLARLPFPVDAVIDAPASWTVRAEGERGAVERHGNRKVSHFRCDLPISYPKVMGGLYTKVAEQKAGGQLFTVYQLEPIKRDVAAKDLQNMVNAAEFYRRNLGPLPFNGYECYDSATYYGIESYSHTFLKKGITTWAVSHEMGHSYFGGLAPCAYVHDSWNEGVTQYIDSIAYQNNADRSLENGLKTVSVPVPLSQMPVAWSYGNTTYYRGAYVLKMLETEIGRDNVLAALKAIAFGRRGMDTRWDDLRAYFERASGKPLDWFWRQWIDGATFPTLSVVANSNGKVTVQQSGTPHPFRLRFAVIQNGQKKVVELHESEATFAADGPTIDVFPYALAKMR